MSEFIINSIVLLFPGTIIIAVMYFTITKPRKKELIHKSEIENNIRNGVYLITSEGIRGKIVSVEDKDIIISTGNCKKTLIRISKKNILELEKH